MAGFRGRPPRVAILGGTGDLGMGLAFRVCRGREVIVGSRDPERARARAREYAALAGCDGIWGTSNAEAARLGDYVVLATPADALPRILSEVVGEIGEGSLVISPVVPMARRGGALVYDESMFGPRSAAEYVAERTGRRVAAAFHTVPAGLLADLRRPLDVDVLVASGDAEFAEIRDGLSIEGVRYLHAGPLEAARCLERMVPLLLEVGRRNRIRNPYVKVIGP